MSSANTTFDPEAQPPRRGCAKPVLIILAVVGVLGVLICCGGGAAMYFWGTGFLAGMVEDQLRDNPVIMEHIGEIEEFDFDVTATGENQVEQELVFSVRGTKGGGRVEVVLGQNQPDQVESGWLVMDDGTEYDLFPEEP